MSEGTGPKLPSAATVIALETAGEKPQVTPVPGAGGRRRRQAATAPPNGHEPVHSAMVRPLSVLALVMLLGALTTIATAWGLAAWAPFSDAGPRVSGAFLQWGEPWHITRMRRFGGGVRLHWWSNLTGDEPSRTPADLLRAVTRRSTPNELVAASRTRLGELERTGATRYPIKVDNTVPMWGTFTGATLPQAVRIGSDTAFGWPAPCLSYQVIAGFNRVTMSPSATNSKAALC